MASISIYTPTIDKENVTRSTNIKSSKGQIRSQDGNIFQKNFTKSSGTPFRRALGDVNRSFLPKQDSSVTLKPTEVKSKSVLSMQPPKSVLKPNRQKTEKPKTNIGTSLTYEVKTVNCFIDDIESMHQQTSKEEDNFDAIWPESERPATYIEPLKAWRQWPIMEREEGNTNEEDDSCILSKFDEDICERVSERSFEEPNMGEEFGVIFPLLSLEDLPLPPYEELQLQALADESLYTIL